MKQGVPQASLRASEAAKRLEPRGHGAKRSPQGRNTAQALAQGGAKVWDDHAELRGAWAHNTPRRKIPFSRAKIASLQFPRPKIRRILAETGRGARRPRAVRETGRSKPNEQGSIASRQAQQDDHCELWMWQWRGAHETRALWAKQREVSPISKGVLQAARRSRTTIANCG